MMYGWGDGWAGLLWMVVFWGAIVAVVYALLRGVTGSQRSSEQARPSPLEILDERFARGEISSDEYAERRRVLGASKG